MGLCLLLPQVKCMKSRYRFLTCLHLGFKKNDIMPFAATWVDLEIIILNEVSQNKTNIMWYGLYAESKKKMIGASLVVQWLRIRLPMQGTRVPALVREDPTCCRATKPVCHNYWACALEPESHSYWACVPQLLKSVCLEPVLRNKRSHCNEKPSRCHEE